jgi:hypothetical protein
MPCSTIGNRTLAATILIEWAYTGTAYGGDDDRNHGEGRAYCVQCGADGDA